MKNNKTILIIGGILGFLGVALGAFGAHSLEKTLSENMLEIYHTGIYYHLIHTVIIISIAFWANKKFFASAWFFIAGVILFSFSLYFYAVTSILFFAFVTPFGGISFLIGWALIIWNGIKLKS